MQETGQTKSDVTPAQLALVALFTLAILAFDFYTGRRIQFPVLYILPVAWLSWHGLRNVALAYALVLPLVRFAFQTLWGGPVGTLEAGVNALLRIAVLGLFAYLVHRTGQQSKELQREVKALRGLVSICSSCKRIRNEAGVYEPLELYLEGHSEAMFSHGLCTECAVELYPEIRAELEERNRAGGPPDACGGG